MNKVMLFIGLVLAMICLRADAASEQRQFGDPVRVFYGDLRVGYLGTNAGTLYIEPAGANTSGTLAIQSKDAGGVTRGFSLAHSTLAAGNTTYSWPPAYPAGASYVLESTTLGVMSWGLDDTGEFTLAGSSGTQTISNGDTLTVAAGTGILSTPVTATDTVTINTVWKRTGTQIEPQTADDYVKVQIGTPAGTAPTSGAIRAFTADSYAIYAHSDSQFGVFGTSVSGVGVEGYSQSGRGVMGLSVNTTGVYGESTNYYGVYSVNATYSGGFYDVSDETSVANPPANTIRIWAASDGMAYSQTSGGIIAALTSQGKETHWVSGGLDSNANSLVNWIGVANPTVTTPTFAFKAKCTITTPGTIGDALMLTDSYGNWAWTARIDVAHGVPHTQGSVTIGSPFQLFSGDAGNTKCKAARAYCRVRVNDVSYFNSIKLTLSDATGANSATATLLASMSNNAWYEGATAITDISSWTGPLRVSVVAYGRALAGVEALNTTFDCEWVACEQYAN